MELSNANYQNTDKKRKTTPQLTKYEKTKILGIRAQQLLSGMPALIKVPKGVNNVRKIAELELKAKDVPYEERDHALYIAFAPYKEPRYSISVLIEHGGSGSKAAAPLASKLIKKIIDRHKMREQTRKANITLA